MKTTTCSLIIFMAMLAACVPQSVVTPSPMPASTNTPPAATPEPDPTQTLETTHNPFQITELPVESCSQLVDATISNAGVLEVIYDYRGESRAGGDGPQDISPQPWLEVQYSNLMLDTQFWLWSEDTQETVSVNLPSDAVGTEISADHRWVIFRRDFGEIRSEGYFFGIITSELWVMDTNGQNEKKLAVISINEVEARNPNIQYAILDYGWVPHTESIYYKVALVSEGVSITTDAFTLIDIHSGNAVPITQARGAGKFIFAPDGSAIAFLSEPPQADVSQNGSQPAALQKGSELRMVNTNDGSVQFTLPIQIRNDLLEFSPDGKYAIGLAYDGIIHMNVKDGAWRKIPLNYTTISGALPKFTWTDNSTVLAPITNLPEGVREINHVDLLRDPGANFTVWKVNLTDASAQPVQTFSGVTFSVEFSPDGNHMVFRENGVQGLSSNAKYAAFHEPGVKMGGVGESPDLMLADLNTGNILATLEANKFFFWSPDPDLYIYHQIGDQVDGIHPWGIFLGQIGKDPIFIKLETGLSLFGSPLFFTTDWVDAERFVMNVGCEISLVALAR